MSTDDSVKWIRFADKRPDCYAIAACWNAGKRGYRKSSILVRGFAPGWWAYPCPQPSESMLKYLLSQFIPGLKPTFVNNAFLHDGVWCDLGNIPGPKGGCALKMRDQMAADKDRMKKTYTTKGGDRTTFCSGCKHIKRLYGNASSTWGCSISGRPVAPFGVCALFSSRVGGES